MYWKMVWIPIRNSHLHSIHCPFAWSERIGRERKKKHQNKSSEWFLFDIFYVNYAMYWRFLEKKSTTCAHESGGRRNATDSLGKRMLPTNQPTRHESREHVDNDNEQHDTLNVTRASAVYKAQSQTKRKRITHTEWERKKSHLLHRTQNRFAAPTVITRSSKTKSRRRKKKQSK